MRQRTRRKIRATTRVILEMLAKSVDAMLVLSKGESLKRIRAVGQVSFDPEDYYAVSVDSSVGRLVRKGLVEVSELGGETQVKITKSGKEEVLKYKLEELGIEPQEKWDKKWRLVMFDVDENDRRKRNKLREWLEKLGLKRWQKSVWVYPYPLEREVRFLREVLEVPHAVKLITAEMVENDGELREIFDL